MSNHPSILIYDVEIKRPPPDKKLEPEPDIEYAEGWKDYQGMDITVVTAYSYRDGFPRIFLKDNLDEFMKLVSDHEILAGFNNIGFDNPLLLAALGLVILEAESYDLLLEIREAAGVNQFAKGYNLDNCARTNLGVGKSGEGAQAPVLWQRGRHGSVIDYGLRDSWITKGLLDLVIAGTPLLNPGRPAERIFVRPPA